MIKQFDDCSLRPFGLDDIEKKIEWINNPENNAFLHYDIPLEYEKTLNWFKNKDNSKRLDCVIEYKSCPVGVIGLLAIDYTSKKAEYYITLGSTEHKRMGIATKATMMILEYAFVDLNLNKIYLTVDADNIAACNLYESTGFVCEGNFAEDQERRGQLVDRKRYAYLKKNWNYGWRKNG